jgi:hypothetical protein
MMSTGLEYPRWSLRRNPNTGVPTQSVHLESWFESRAYPRLPMLETVKKKKKNQVLRLVFINNFLNLFPV